MNTYTVTAHAVGNGAGTVASNTGGVSYSYPGVNTGTTSALNHGTNVVLTATASTGSTVSWTTCSGTPWGNGTGVATCTYPSLDGNKTAQATFTLNTYMVTANATGNGTGWVRSDVGEVNYDYPVEDTETSTPLNHGINVVLTASAATGSTAAWASCGGAPLGNGTAEATCTYTGLEGNQAATVTFTLNRYSLSLNPYGTGSGNVGDNGIGIDCDWNGDMPSGACLVNVDYGTLVNLTAAPNAGSTFNGWSGGTGSASGCAGTGSCAFTVWEASVVGAPFARINQIHLPLIIRP